MLVAALYFRSWLHLAAEDRRRSCISALPIVARQCGRPDRTPGSGDHLLRPARNRQSGLFRRARRLPGVVLGSTDLACAGRARRVRSRLPGRACGDGPGRRAGGAAGARLFYLIIPLVIARVVLFFDTRNTAAARTYTLPFKRAN